MRDEYAEYHLTPAGWKAGSWRKDNGQKVDIPRPDDAVKAIKHVRPWRGAPSNSVEWEHEDKKLVKKLMKQYPDEPFEI